MIAKIPTCCCHRHHLRRSPPHYTVRCRFCACRFCCCTSGRFTCYTPGRSALLPLVHLNYTCCFSTVLFWCCLTCYLSWDCLPPLDEGTASFATCTLPLWVSGWDWMMGAARLLFVPYGSRLCLPGVPAFCWMILHKHHMEVSSVSALLFLRHRDATATAAFVPTCCHTADNCVSQRHRACDFFACREQPPFRRLNTVLDTPRSMVYHLRLHSGGFSRNINTARRSRFHRSAAEHCRPRLDGSPFHRGYLHLYAVLRRNTTAPPPGTLGGSTTACGDAGLRSTADTACEQHLSAACHAAAMPADTAACRHRGSPYNRLLSVSLPVFYLYCWRTAILTPFLCCRLPFAFPAATLCLHCYNMVLPGVSTAHIPFSPAELCFTPWTPPWFRLRSAAIRLPPACLLT